MRRVKQLLSAIQAVVTPQDQEFAAQFLTPPEYALFWQMNVPDQRHCLNVAYTIIEYFTSGSFRDINRTVVIKAALLHDIGRRCGDVSTVDKILAVAARSMLGSEILQRWGRLGRGGVLENLRHAFYVSAWHPQIGADLLRSVGSEESVIQLVRCHHDPPDLTDSRELRLLRYADDLN